MLWLSALQQHVRVQLRGAAVLAAAFCFEWQIAKIIHALIICAFIQFCSPAKSMFDSICVCVLCSFQQMDVELNIIICKIVLDTCVGFELQIPGCPKWTLAWPETATLVLEPSASCMISCTWDTSASCHSFCWHCLYSSPIVFNQGDLRICRMNSSFLIVLRLILDSGVYQVNQCTCYTTIRVTRRWNPIGQRRVASQHSEYWWYYCNLVFLQFLHSLLWHCSRALPTLVPVFFVVTALPALCGPQWHQDDASSLATRWTHAHGDDLARHTTHDLEMNSNKIACVGDTETVRKVKSRNKVVRVFPSLRGVVGVHWPWMHQLYLWSLSFAIAGKMKTYSIQSWCQCASATQHVSQNPTPPKTSEHLSGKRLLSLQVRLVKSCHLCIGIIFCWSLFVAFSWKWATVNQSLRFCGWDKFCHFVDDIFWIFRPE